jgi:membrane protease YdiL (CAAX protease family)
MNIFLNKDRKIRSLWWVTIFFLILAVVTIPLIVISSENQFEITLVHQAIIIVMVNVVCQLISREPISKLTGNVDYYFAKSLLTGALIGSILMALPAMFMFVAGMVHWNLAQVNRMDLALAVTIIIAGVIAEEFLFRGFLFQRLISGLGVWPAQLIIASLFVLTHLNNPGMTGTTKVLASINIFIASLLFGLAYIKTESLAMPIGLHFMANLMQGTILGFGVSGNDEVSFLKPVFGQQPDWITGGSFGLEASIFGLSVLLLIVFFFVGWYPSRRV